MINIQTKPSTIASNILQTVGNTSLVQLSKLFIAQDFKVYGKSEYNNPSGSIKDRTALSILKDALNKGLINENSTIVESSSGNMALGLAQACLYLGLKLIVVVDPKINLHTQKLLETYQVKIIKVEQPLDDGGFLGARLAKIQELLHNIPNSYWTNQYGNQANPLAHHQTMEEIFKDLNRKVDYLFMATSTCGTIMGCANYIHKYQLPTKIIAVDAKGSVLFGGESKKRIVPGHGAAVPSQFLDTSKLYDHVEVSDLDCIKGCWSLLSNEAILCGGSTGGVVQAIQQYAYKIPKNSNCVMMLCDRGERYLDTIYNKDWINKNIPEANNFVQFRTK